MLGFTCFGQQDPQYTQYMYNTVNINPAYAGNRGAISIFGLHRTQWVGLEGAPVTNSFSIHSPIDGSNLGLGLSLVNDKIGATADNTISADISYTIQTSDEYNLSFGLKASANFFSIDINKLNPADVLDPALYNLDNDFTPNFGAGVYYYSDKLYLGISVPRFLESTKYDDNTISVYKERMNIYYMGGYVFDINESLKFKPSVLFKTVEGSPLQVDMSGNVLFNDKFTLGIAYRLNAAFSALAGFQISKSLFVGYTYDLETTNLANYNSGSHEIFLRFEIFPKQYKIMSPRFF